MTHTPFDKQIRGWLSVGSSYEDACPEALWEPRPDAKRLETMSFQDAFSRRWAADRHAVTYAIRGPDGNLVPDPPRLRKPHLAAVQARGFKVLHVMRGADADMPAHANITAEQVRLAAGILRDYPCAWWVTRGGVHIYQVLSRPLSPAEYEVTVSRWVTELQAMFATTALKLDTDCMDWTRFMRLPLVIRPSREDRTVKLNLWHTLVQTKNLAIIDPGDCVPPPPVPKVWRPKPQASGDRPGALKVLDIVSDALRRAAQGERNPTLAKQAYYVGTFVGGGQLRYETALSALCDAISLWDPEAVERLHSKTLVRCLEAGMESPRYDNSRERFGLAAMRNKWTASLAPKRPDPSVDGFDIDDVNE